MTEPPDPTAWREGSITLERGPDGILSGQITLHDARWRFEGWTFDRDHGLITFRAEPIHDAEFEALMAAAFGEKRT